MGRQHRDVPSPGSGQKTATGQPGLQAGKLAWATQKPFRRLTQLARSRGVLGIEYDKEFAAQQRQNAACPQAVLAAPAKSFLLCRESNRAK